MHESNITLLLIAGKAEVKIEGTVSNSAQYLEFQDTVKVTPPTKAKTYFQRDKKGN